MTNANQTPQTGAALISVKQAAALIMVTEIYFNELCRKGYIPKAERGKVSLVAAVQGYIKWLKDAERRASKSAMATKVQEARAKEIEFRLARESREIIATEDAFAAMDYVIGPVKSELSGLGARITRDIALRRQIEKEVDGALDRACDRIGEARRALAEGHNPLAAGEEDAAGSMGAGKPHIPRKRGRPRTPRPVLNAL